MEIIWIPTNLLVPYSGNAKAHPPTQIEKIIASISEFGWKQPIVVSSHNEVVVGHGRLIAAKEMQLEKVPCVVADLTSELIRLYRIADNRTAQSEWIEDLLSEELTQLSLLPNIDLSLTGFDEAELAALVKNLENSSPLADESEKEAEKEVWQPREDLVVGSIWKLGRHRLICADSTNEETISLLLGDTNVEVVWSDPPYGVNCQKKDGRIGSRGKAKSYPIIHGDNDKSIAIASFKLYNKLFPKVPQIWWGANHYSECFPSSPCWIVWDKQNGETDFADAELAWTNFNTAVRIFRWTWNGYVKQGEAAQEKRCHPNQKPVEMVSWYWEKYAPGSTVMLDPFLGSGTTIMAAQKHPERTVFGMEIMPEYCEAILRRWEKITGCVAEKV
jgi:DNA modification methylase